MTHKKPPQGTHSIVSKNREDRGRAAAEVILDDCMCYNVLQGDEDFDKLISTSTPDPELWKLLVARHGKNLVGRAYRFARRTP